MHRLVIIILLLLVGCTTANIENNYHKPTNRTLQGGLAGFMGGTMVGPLTPSIPSLMVAGTITGGVTGALIGSRKGLRKLLSYYGVRVIIIGDTVRLIIPSDYLFYPNTSEIREDRYGLLVDTLDLLYLYPNAPIKIAAFGDDTYPDAMGVRLTRHQAESVMGFFWSRGISYERMTAVGYGARGDIASNDSVLGSELNRHVDIMWDVRPIIR